MLDGVVRHALSTRQLSATERDKRIRRARAAVRTLQSDVSFRTGRVGALEARRPTRTVQRSVRRTRPGILAAVATAVAMPQRTIYDAGHSQRTPGREVRGEGDPATLDAEVNEAYEGLGATFDLFLQVFGRNSIDDRGLPLKGVVHFGRDYDNAFWDGTQMSFGDGDRQVFERFTITVDIMGHELTHGVTENEAGLIYWAQAGALNESISDVFGSLVKQYLHGQTVAQADWLIGADTAAGTSLLAAGVNGAALRSMKDPGTAYNDPALGGQDPQPGEMADYVQGFSDNGGVHINSGIPNRAFYLAANAIGGHAWETAGQVWYETLRSSFLRPNTRFLGFARLTLATAQRLFGGGSREVDAIGDAWTKVGIDV